MTARDFAYFLQGFFEVAGVEGWPAGGLSAAQADCIRRHLALVFASDIDPAAGPPETQAKLDAIHHGTTPKPPKGILADYLTPASVDKDVRLRC